MARTFKNEDKFPIIYENGKNYCRVCKKELSGRKTSFCGRRCLRDFFMQTDWDRIRRIIYSRDGGICMKCGKWIKSSYHVDHIIPISKSGEEFDLSNLELSCPECNLKKHNKEDIPNIDIINHSWQTELELTETAIKNLKKLKKEILNIVNINIKTINKE